MDNLSEILTQVKLLKLRVDQHDKSIEDIHDMLAITNEAIHKLSMEDKELKHQLIQSIAAIDAKIDKMYNPTAVQVKLLNSALRSQAIKEKMYERLSNDLIGLIPRAVVFLLGVGIVFLVAYMAKINPLDMFG